MEEATTLQVKRDNGHVANHNPSGDPYINMIERVCTDPDFDISKMEKLMEMKDKHEAKVAQQAFAQAMAECQTAMPSILKDAENNHTRSKYATLGSIQRAIKPTYAAHGLSVTFGEEDCPKDGWVRTTCRIQHKGGHTETYHRDGPLDGAGMAGKTNKTQIQAIASTHTYNQRYLLCGAFAIAIVDEDHDGNSPAPQVEYITDDQAFELSEMLSACESQDPGYEKVFTDWLKTAVGVDSFTACPASRYGKIKATFQKKMKGESK